MYSIKSGKLLVLLVTLLALSLFISCAVATAGEQTIKVEVDGKVISFDVQPVVENGRTLTPLRGIFEALGAKVKWDNEFRTVTAIKGDTVIKLTIGSTIAYKNNEKIILDVPAKIIEGRTLVPVRFISESLGNKVKWDGTARLVSISGGGIIKEIAEKVIGGIEKIVKSTEEASEKLKEETPGTSGGGGSKPAPPTEITITDSNGKKITIPQPLERVVVLNGDIATAVKILGVQDTIVGVADTVAEEKFLEVADKPSVGKWSKPNLEKIVELNPQVVFAYGKWPGEELEENLEPLGIKVVRINCYIPNTLDSDFRTVAKMFGKENRMEDFIGWKNDIIKILAKRTSDLNSEQKVKAFAISSSKLAKGQWTTYGKGTSTNEGITNAGGINVAGEFEGYPEISTEWVLAQNPNVLVIPCYCGELGYDATDYSAAKAVKEAAINNDTLKYIKAVEKGRVYLLSSKLLGGVNTSFGALYLAKWFYPECFTGVDPEQVHKEYFEKWLGVKYKGKWNYPPEFN